ncbi:MAG: Re/Si-specific NAD(P)(+) transhydrogenase subunit alpha [Pseudomonadota bacterium]
MKLAVPAETRDGETRVAASPETVKKLIGLGFDIAVQKGAGAASAMTDAAYEAAGATLGTAATVVGDADIVLKVRAPSDAERKRIKAGAALIGILDAYNDADSLKAYAAGGINAFAMELAPRITRAQSMDVLSSQSNLAGYKAVLDGSAEIGSALPMMMTAAGTVPAARCFVMGAGVAGLQAIATARRLGAIVSATDVRYAAKEQVESLGATFVSVDEEVMKAAETEGGYAKEMGEDFQRRQREHVTEHLKKQNLVILTALIPGRQAPTLVTEEMVKGMPPGSVIVDLAVEQGGNCELSKPGEIVEAHGVKILGHRNVPGRLPANASALYAKNLLNFVQLIVADGALAIDWDDEIVKGVALTRDGKIIHPRFAEEAAAPAEPEAEPEPDEAPAAANDGDEPAASDDE